MKCGETAKRCRYYIVQLPLNRMRTSGRGRSCGHERAGGADASSDQPGVEWTSTSLLQWTKSAEVASGERAYCVSTRDGTSCYALLQRLDSVKAPERSVTKHLFILLSDMFCLSRLYCHNFGMIGPQMEPVRYHLGEDRTNILPQVRTIPAKRFWVRSQICSDDDRQWPRLRLARN